jgi:hypothetical protein
VLARASEIIEPTNDKRARNQIAVDPLIGNVAVWFKSLSSHARLRWRRAWQSDTLKSFTVNALRIATTSGLSGPQIVSDLGLGLSMLNTWVQKYPHDDVM